jgi:hypothetical protein
MCSLNLSAIAPKIRIVAMFVMFVNSTAYEICAYVL